MFVKLKSTLSVVVYKSCYYKLVKIVRFKTHLESSNMLWVRGADTGLPPRENLRGVPEHELVVSVPSQ